MAAGPIHRESRPSPWRAILIGAALAAAGTAGAASWFVPHVPPDCADARTIALVREALDTGITLPPSATLEHIRTVAGGFLALRFVCQAELAGLDRTQLPDSPTPQTVDYTSQRVEGRHLVSAALVRPLRWEKVE